MLDDVQDSDEDMEDYDEESEEDEGSLYAPSEATSELSIEEEEEASRDVDLVELPLVDPCNFLLLLPRELRDKVGVLSAAPVVRALALTICLRI